MLVDRTGVLRGIFTDSDLARLFEDRCEQALDEPIANVMTADPKTIQRGATLSDAVKILAGMKISELPVVNKAGLPIGLIDITDIVDIPLELDDDEVKKEDDPITLPFPRRTNEVG